MYSHFFSTSKISWVLSEHYTTLMSNIIAKCSFIQLVCLSISHIDMFQSTLMFSNLSTALIISLVCSQTMQAVNKKMDPKKTMQTMQNFQRENAKMEMTEEMSERSL